MGIKLVHSQTTHNRCDCTPRCRQLLVITEARSRYKSSLSSSFLAHPRCDSNQTDRSRSAQEVSRKHLWHPQFPRRNVQLVCFAPSSQWSTIYLLALIRDCDLWIRKRASKRHEFLQVSQNTADAINYLLSAGSGAQEYLSERTIDLNIYIKAWHKPDVREQGGWGDALLSVEQNVDWVQLLMNPRNKIRLVLKQSVSGARCTTAKRALLASRPLTSRLLTWRSTIGRFFDGKWLARHLVRDCFWGKEARVWTTGIEARKQFNPANLCKWRNSRLSVKAKDSCFSVLTCTDNSSGVMVRVDTDFAVSVSRIALTARQSLKFLAVSNVRVSEHPKEHDLWFADQTLLAGFIIREQDTFALPTASRGEGFQEDSHLLPSQTFLDRKWERFQFGSVVLCCRGILERVFLKWRHFGEAVERVFHITFAHWVSHWAVWKSCVVALHMAKSIDTTSYYASRQHISSCAVSSIPRSQQRHTTERQNTCLLVAFDHVWV